LPFFVLFVSWEPFFENPKKSKRKLKSPEKKQTLDIYSLSQEGEIREQKQMSLKQITHTPTHTQEKKRRGLRWYKKKALERELKF
jgi:hypothetical protein